MPLYTFQCREGHAFEGYVPRSGETRPCEECGGETEIVWSAPIAGGRGFPFTTRNFNGKPIEVKSESHLKRLCTQFGVTHRPDSAWLTKRFEGVDPKTKQVKYSESSGVGLKGCWV